MFFLLILLMHAFIFIYQTTSKRHKVLEQTRCQPFITLYKFEIFNVSHCGNVKFYLSILYF